MTYTIHKERIAEEAAKECQEKGAEMAGRVAYRNALRFGCSEDEAEECAKMAAFIIKWWAEGGINENWRAGWRPYYSLDEDCP